MKTEKDLTPAQQQLWIKAAKSIAKQHHTSALVWLQLLLQSEPEFFEARRLARKVGLVSLSKECDKKFLRWKKRGRSFFALRKIKSFVKKKNFSQALIALESLFAEDPKHIAAHRLIADVAMQWQRPLREVALLSLEAVVKTNEKNISLQLELANFCLQQDEIGCAWNPARAREAYAAVLAIDPHHLGATQGLKNAIALSSMQQDGWSLAESYRELLRSS